MKFSIFACFRKKNGYPTLSLHIPTPLHHSVVFLLVPTASSLLGCKLKKKVVVQGMSADNKLKQSC